ncbi:Uncharacterised protein [Mycobacterium tuberculosis]|nr:Uncharacterised protein [Mycobacterium tuberculosis]
MRIHCTPRPFSVASMVWFLSTRLCCLSTARSLISSSGVEMMSCVPVAEV